VFSLDIRRPGMLTAVVAHPPLFGATVASVDDAEARKVPGVVDVVRIPTGVAVLARDTFAALKGREALGIAWDESRAEKRSSDQIMVEYKQLARTRGLVAANKGDASRAIAGAAKVLESEFEFPYLAHAAMEPMNGTLERRPDGTYEAWAGFQLQTIEQATMASILGVTPKR
jgi:isoquinoline 1-oxidoreductase beta subunit